MCVLYLYVFHVLVFDIFLKEQLNPFSHLLHLDDVTSLVPVTGDNEAGLGPVTDPHTGPRLGNHHNLTPVSSMSFKI